MGNKIHLACWRGDEDVLQCCARDSGEFFTSKCNSPGVFGVNAFLIVSFRGYISELLWDLLLHHVQAHDALDQTVCGTSVCKLAERRPRLRERLLNYKELLKGRLFYRLGQSSSEMDHLSVATAHKVLCSKEGLLGSLLQSDSNGIYKPINPIIPTFFTPVFVAVLTNKVEFIEALTQTSTAGQLQNHARGLQAGYTLLHLAAYLDHFQLVPLLVKAGCSVEEGTESDLYCTESDLYCTKSDLYCTPLVVAAQCGNVRSIKALCDHGSKLHSPHSLFALQAAARGGHSLAVQMLVGLGCKVNDCLSRDYVTPLHTASCAGYTDTVSTLLELGAGVKAVTRVNHSALDLAVLYSSANAVLPLVKAGLSPYHASSDESISPICLAVWQGELSALKEMLLAKPPSPGNTSIGPPKSFVFPANAPVHFAACVEDTKALKLLVDLGCPKESSALMPNGSTLTPLQIATVYQALQSIRVLADLGCDMSYPADSTPLHLAVRDGSVEAVGTLLECGADPNVRNSDSMLPIQMAAVRNKASIIELLVRHGSYLSSDHSRSSTSEEQDCRNSTGGNAGSSWQMSSHLTEETHGSLANVCSNYPPLFLAIMSNSEEAAVRLLELGADPNTCQFKVPALSIASRYDNSNIVSKLIDCGAKLDTVDCFGDYPIHTAIKFDQPNIVCILVSKFPMYLRTNAKVGNLILTPFQLACLFCRCSVLTVLWKLQDDADCLSTTSFNLSPVHLVVLGRKLTQSADPFTGHSESPFSISLQNEEKTLNFLIIKRFPVSERDEFGLTALDLALQYEYVDLVYLLQQPEVNADTGKYARGMEMLGLVIQNLERQIGYTTTENVSSRGKLFGLEGNIDNLEKRCGDMEKKYNELQFSADLYSQTISAEPPESPAVPPRAPSPSWMEQYRKATKQHGSVTLHVTRCVLIGPPRVGKSSLKILLVRNEPQCVETSTDLMEAPVVLTSIQHKENGSQWKELTPIDLGHIVNKCTKEEEYNPTLNSPQAQGLSSSHSPVHSRLFQGSSISLANFSSGINETSGNDPHPISFEPEGSIGKDFETNFDSFLSKTMSERSRAELQLNGLKMVHLFDCGGQLAFQDTIPLLINAPCAFVAVFNASVDLDEEMELKYCREKGKELTLGHKESQWHMLRRILSSIHSLQYKCHRDIVHLIKGNKVPSSPVAVVGTHKDLLNKEKDGGLRQKEAEEKIAKRFEQLRESKPYTFLRERGCTHVLVENVSKADLNVINSLRKDIESQATLQIELPLSWIVLELFTRSYHLKQKFIPFDVLHQLCIRHKIVSHKEEFLSLLQVLHVLGFYAFYQLDGEEQNWVCTDAATLYREVTKILMVQHREEFRKEATYELKTCGRIKYNKTTLQDLFTDLDINISGADPMWFVRVLLHIGLAANVKIEGEEEEVFIPLALPCDRSILPQIASVATVCFTLEFPCSHRKGRNCAKITDVPRGIFPHLIVHLLSQQCLEECEWMVDEGDSRTCIKLIHRSDSYFIYLMDYVDRIEMALSLNNTFFSTENNPKRATKVYELCQNLHDVLKKALEATFVAVFGDQDPNQDDQRRPSVVCGFKCSTCQDSSHMTVVQPSVECTPQHPRYTAKCVHKAPPTNVVQPDQLIWFCPVEQAIFEEESTLHMWIMKGTLDSGNIVKGIHEFLPYYLKMAPHLRELGAALGVSDLSNAIIDGNGTPGDKCLQVLQCWLNQTRRPTWELFCQRLSLAGCFTAVAHDIAKDHGLPYP